jgi:hypothetical protein
VRGNAVKGFCTQSIAKLACFFNALSGEYSPALARKSKLANPGRIPGEPRANRAALARGFPRSADVIRELTLCGSPRRVGILESARVRLNRCPSLASLRSRARGEGRVKGSVSLG